MRITPAFVTLVASFVLVLGLSACSGSSTSDTDAAQDTMAPNDTGDATGDVPTGDVPTGDVPTGDVPTGDVPTGDVPTADVPGDVPGDVTGTSGCGVAPTNVEVALDVDGRSRTFVLSLPANYDENTPQTLIYALHGLGGTGTLAQAYFGLQDANNSAIIVYPNALPLPAFGGSTGWELMDTGYDFDFMDALHTHLTASLCIDESQVFLTGHSFGGYMSNQLGCHRGDRFAAIAPVAGGGPYGVCGDPVPTWLTHGTLDTVVLLSEGQGARDAWTNVNGCDGGTMDVSPTGCVAYTGCEEDVHWCQHPGGHEWPAFAGAAIWNFFQAHQPQ